MRGYISHFLRRYAMSSSSSSSFFFFIHSSSSSNREYMSSFSLYHDLPYACQLHKLIPGDRLVSFSVWHYYPALHPSTALQLHTADENIRAGYFPWMPLLKSDYYEYLTCWNDTLTISFNEQDADRKAAPPHTIAITDHN
jgi:hypothetical protein